MRRRELITLFGGAAAAWPFAARAQRSERMRQVGMLIGLPENDPEGKARVRAFRLGMRDLEWIEGRNIQIDTRFVGSDRELIKKHVAELIRQPPDVILANNTPVVAALRRATNSIPIIFAVVNDPVGQGFIPNLSRPGGNIRVLVHRTRIGRQVDQHAPGREAQPVEGGIDVQPRHRALL